MSSKITSFYLKLRPERKIWKISRLTALDLGLRKFSSTRQATRHENNKLRKSGYKRIKNGANKWQNGKNSLGLKSKSPSPATVG